jgi:hypothetical protein
MTRRAAQDALRDQLVEAAVFRAEAGRAAQRELRDQLVDAAERESPGRPGRRRRRAVISGVAVALLAAAGASATGLISVGEPVPRLPDRRPADPRVQPLGQYAQLVATAPDPEGRHVWGVGIYTSADGRDCAIAGHVRGTALGLERAGTFHPYGKSPAGSCEDLRRRPFFMDILVPKQTPARTIFFGRTAGHKRPVIVRVGNKDYPAPPGRGGAFLLVFSGRLTPSDAVVIDHGGG